MERVKAALSKQFAHLYSAARCKKKLKNTFQGNDETLTGFRTRIKNLAQHAYPETVDESSVIEIVKDSFIDGLSDRNVQEKVLNRNPRAIDEAHEYALHALKNRDQLKWYRDNSHSLSRRD